VILPNGKAVIFGGSSQGNENPVYVPEMFDPVNETWTSLAAASIARVYHGVALLLPDGSVWTASSSITRTTSEKRTEIYRPDYFLSGSRPTITGTPLVGDYGNSITLSTPDPASITMASLVKLPCATHHYDTDARLVWLQVTGRSSNTVTVASPLNANLAPPGYYMIHLLNGSNIPSTASIIKIPGVGSGTSQDTTPPAQVTGLSITVVSSNQLNLTWDTNTEPDLARYYVYRGTTGGFSVTPGTTVPVGQPTTNSFPDTALASSTTYYYKVAAVDTSGNIGPLSTEVSGTTPTNPIFYNVTPPGNSSQNLRSGGATRYGEEPATSASVLVGKSIRTLKVRMRKKGNPSGAILARIRRKTDDAIIVNFTQIIQAANLGASFGDYIFTLSNAYIITSGDRILIEYSGQNGIDIETWNTEKFDGTNTRSVSYTNGYAFASTSDMVGTMSS